MDTSKTSASRRAWSGNELSSQLHAMDSILDLAAQLHLAPSLPVAPLSSDTSFALSSQQQQEQEEAPPTPLPQPGSIKVADLVLDIERSQGQLAQMESQLRNIKKLHLANDFSSYSINDRIRCLDVFSQQIALLHQNRVQLLDKLIRSSSSSSSSVYQQRQQERGVIMMEPQFHRDFVDLFYKIQDEIPKVDGHLKALETWKRDAELIGQRSSSLSSPSTGTTIDRLKTSLDSLRGLSQQQLEILEASSKLQANFIKVTQSSSSSSSFSSATIAASGNVNK